MDENFKVGNFICERRRDLGLSQAELGQMLNVTNKAVSRWENGRGLPDTSLILPLSEALGVTADELLHGRFITTVIESESPQEEAREEKNRSYSYICAKKLLIRDSLLVIPVFLFNIFWLVAVFGFNIDLSFGGSYGASMTFNLLLPLFLIGTAQIIYAVTLIFDTVKMDDKSLPIKIILCIAAWFAVNYLYYPVYIYRVTVFLRRRFEQRKNAKG